MGDAGGPGGHDATYVAAGREALDCPLATADRRLARAPGVACEVIPVAG
jgi:predicted nucleic acid-binding protein